MEGLSREREGLVSRCATKVCTDQGSGIGLQDQEDQECWKDPKKGSV